MTLTVTAFDGEAGAFGTHGWVTVELPEGEGGSGLWVTAFDDTPGPFGTGGWVTVELPVGEGSGLTVTAFDAAPGAFGTHGFVTVELPTAADPPDPPPEPDAAGILLNGSAWLTAPDHARLDITGDVDIRVAFKITSWGTGFQTLIAKSDSNATPAGHYCIYFNSSRRPILGFKGTGTREAQAGNNPTSTSGIICALRCTLDVDNGAGGNTIAWYEKATTVETCLADILDDSGWGGLGTPSTVAGVAAIANGDGALSIGAFNDGWGYMAGTFYGAVVLDGINGEIVAFPRFDFQQDPQTDEAGNVWTHAGGGTWSWVAV